MKKLTTIFASALLVLVAFSAGANNIKVSNIELTGQNTEERYTFVQFDLQWENSWRYDTGPSNWDAAWIVVKFRETAGEWNNARLSELVQDDTGHQPPDGATIDVGLLDPYSDYHETDNPVIGAFLYRSEDNMGGGDFVNLGVKLRWNYGENEVPDDAILDIQVIAIEMVYVPAGRFFLGSGGNEENRFHAGGHTDITPFHVPLDWDGTIGNSGGGLWATDQIQSGTLDSEFPTGLDAFYIMKYEVSQQQYVDFLNSLLFEQAQARWSSSNTDYRHGIIFDVDAYSTDLPDVANNFMSWMDGAAYADWAGLRPMSELEFEKASRRPLNPQRDAYAWGNVGIIAPTGINAGSEGADDERVDPIDANAVYGEETGGPVRVGSFARTETTRTQAGATYWGAMEMSGNLWTPVVSLSSSEGLGFKRNHGDGVVSHDGYANVVWPGFEGDESTGYGDVNSAEGTGLRGGAWNTSREELRKSNRAQIGTNATDRLNNYGFRAVRTAPVPNP